MNLPVLHHLHLPLHPTPSSASVLRRRLTVGLYRRLPAWGQDLAVRVAAPKTSLGVCAVIVDAAGRILVVRYPDARQEWGLPGGFVEAGEVPQDALVREVREELGLTATVGPLLATTPHRRRRHLTLYYQARVAGVPVPDGIEVVGWRYVPARDVPALFGEETLPWLPLVDVRHAA